MRAAAGQADAALGLVRDCLAVARQLGDKLLIIEVRSANGQLLLGTGNIAGAIDEFRAGLQTAVGLSDPTAQIQLRTFLAIAVFRSGDLVQANSLLTEDARVARAMPNLVAAAMALSMVCDALVAIRRPLDALNVGQEILAKLQSAGAKPQIIEATIGLANLYALAGRPGDSAQCAKQAVAAARETGGPAAAIPVLMRLGTMAMQRGDRAAAIDFLGRARKQVEASGLPTPPVLIQMLGQLGL
jgi:tetratricopeptide (TPR) repeat protein